jgi:HSP20 family protein
MLIRTRLADDPFTRLFDTLLAPRPVGAAPGFGPAFPPVNIWEDGERVVLEAELPGVRMADLEISATAEELRLKGGRTLDRSGANMVRRELMSGGFDRVVALPAPIDVDAVQATLHDGILTITMPKAMSVRARRIEVQHGNAS